MFGYVVPATAALSPEAQERYRAVYCGICHSIERRYGSLERITLSYDLCFPAILLQSMYEEAESTKTGRCLPHPFREQKYASGGIIDYCADMNLLLAYHKALDDKQDDHSLRGEMEAKLLSKSYRHLSELYPEKSRELEGILLGFARLEKQEKPALDELLNLSGEMLGLIYRYRSDEWSSTIENIGKGLGRFVYLLDAYEDLPADIKKNRFNPLRDWSLEEHYETDIKQSLTLLIAEASDNLELLPLVSDLDLLRNILYAGCWSKYEAIHQKRNPGVPAEKNKEVLHEKPL